MQSEAKHLSIFRVALLGVAIGLWGNSNMLAQQPPAAGRLLTAADKVQLDEALRLNISAAELYRQGEYEAAIKPWLRALTVYEKIRGVDHPETEIILDNLVISYGNLGDYAAAEPLCERALKINERTFGPDHPNTASTRSKLTFLYKAQGKFGAAQPSTSTH